MKYLEKQKMIELANDTCIKHLEDKVAKWKRQGIDLEDLIHQMELEIRRMEDVQKSL